MSYSEWFKQKSVWGKSGHLVDHKQMGVGPLGPYTTLALLEAAWPSASNPGKTAYIGATAPYTEYVSNGVTGVSGWKAVVTAYNDPLTGGVNFSDAGLKRKTRFATRRTFELNPFYNNPFISYPRKTNPETITTTLGPSVATGGAVTTEYNVLKSGKKEIAFRTDADRNSNGALLFSLSFEAAFIGPVSVFASGLAAYPLLSPGGVTGWSTAQNGCSIEVDGDWIAFVYGQKSSPGNTATVFVDGMEISGSTAGAISNAIPGGSWQPQWITLQFTDKRKRVLTWMEASPVAIILKNDTQIAPALRAGRALVFGDSNSVRSMTIGESTPIVRQNVATDALECLGYDCLNLGLGSTGFVNDGGGLPNSRQSYSQMIDLMLGTSGFAANRYDVVWLFGTGNDIGIVTTSGQYATVINKALNAFPNATVIVSSVYEGFSQPSVVTPQNALLLAAVQSIGSSRVLWVPTDRAYHPDGQAMWFGTGCVAVPTGDGNADIYLGSVGSGTGDRHANALGCAHAANWFAEQFIALGLPYSR